jgi:hypothetical protein
MQHFHATSWKALTWKIRRRCKDNVKMNLKEVGCWDEK